MSGLEDKMTDLIWWDQRVSFQVFKAASSSSVLMAVARSANLLVDDAPFIAMMASGWFGTLAMRASGILPEESTHLPEAFSELYFRFLMWTVTESCLKLLIQKQRPSHFHRTSSHVGIALNELSQSPKRNKGAAREVVQLKGVMIPGDQFSFPSGHSLRAFACARVLMADPLLHAEFGVARLLGEDGGAGMYFLLALATMVAWARVALGKHSLLDCLAGSLLGVAFVDMFEPAVGHDGRWVYQQCCLAYFTLIGLHCVIDLMRTSDKTDLYGLRSWFGFVDTENQVAFIAGPVIGSWVVALGAGTCLAY
eukprot:m.179389 g.179389  ORF g.179389 m.179389 type:complete len:309 (+) comp14751_c0_seq1:293-1219(+)